MVLLLGRLAGAYGQASSLAAPALVVAPGLHLPADTAVAQQLPAALAGLLVARSQSPNVGAYLPTPAQPEDFMLLDELYGLEQPRPALPATSYRPHLLGITDLDSGRYLVQLGSLGLAPDGLPVLRATCELLARRTTPGRFTFASPLRARTQAWHSTRFGACTFRYATTLDRKAAATYARYMADFDRRLHSRDWPTEVFCCADLPEVLCLAGITYKADYSGYAHSSLSARANHRLLLLDATANRFDPHDLWHQRLRNVVPAASINKAVDEGCAFRYAGSWGLTWPQILTQFKAWAATQPQADWLHLYQEAVNYAPPSQKPLLVSYTLNALIIEQLERDKGFGAVQQLLTCGKMEKGNDNYFRVLTQVAGITQDNFNARVGALVQASHL